MANNRIKLKDRARLIDEYSEKARTWYERGRRCAHASRYSEYYYRMARYHRWVYIWEIKQKPRR